MTEMVLALALVGIIARSIIHDDYDTFLLAVACLALLGFEVLNKLWGTVR